MAVGMALSHGQRGLPGGTSLAFLLAEKRGVRNAYTKPNFTVEEILGWADAFFHRIGHWPHIDSGQIAEASDESWQAVDQALKNGFRGLPGGASLAKLLASERGVRNRAHKPRLTRQQILVWADAHYRSTGVKAGRVRSC
jgi:hypothetical protein